MKNRIALLLPLLFAFSTAGCSAADSSDPSVEDAEVAQEIRGGPRYTLRSAAIFGKYESGDTCTGGFDICESVEVVRKDGGVELNFGHWDGYVARAWQGNGVILFESDERLDDDCDDPGCGNIIKYTGVIYPVKKGNRWVPQIKTTIVAEFKFPDEEGAPEGEVKSVIRYKKQP